MPVRFSMPGSLTVLTTVLLFALSPAVHAQAPEDIADPEIDQDALGPAAPATETTPAAGPDGKWKFQLAVIPFTLGVNFDDRDKQGGRTTKGRPAFGTVQPIITYDSSTIFGGLRYRFYGGTFPYTSDYGYKGYFGEISFPQYAYVGLKLNEGQDRLTVGLQQVPFGLTPFWGSSFIQTVGNTAGLEDVYQPGITYVMERDLWNASVGYFPMDGGDYRGISVDSARYSANIVQADPFLPGGTNNSEQHMFVGRGEYVLHKDADSSVRAGASLWASRIHNNDTDLDGSKLQGAVHLAATQGDLTFLAIGARMDIDPRNPGGQNDTITMGAFDGSYNVATEGYLVSGELNYNILVSSGPFTQIQPYVNYSAFLKDRDDFRTSERLVGGASWTLRDLQGVYLTTEFRTGRNDPYTGTGGRFQGLAEGGRENDWKSAASFIVQVYF